MATELFKKGAGELKIAVCQTKLKWEDKEYNWNQGKKMIHAAKENQAEFVFFPEMSFTGFSMNIPSTIDWDGEIFNKVKQYAKDVKMYIGFGWVAQGTEKAENHYSVINPFGQVITDYIKIHPFSYANENLYFESGSKIVLGRAGELMYSTFICYDLRFPEIFRALPSDTAIVAVPANWPSARANHWKSLLKARAIENQIYVIGINCVGIIDNIEYTGDSCVIDPGGEILKSLENKEGIIYCNIDTQLVKRHKEDFPIRQDRRNEFYRTYY